MSNPYRDRLLSVQFGRGTNITRAKGFDTEALESQIGSLKENEEYMQEVTHGVGEMRWDNGTPYHRDKHGDFQKADDKTVERLLTGGREKESRSFSTGTRK